MKYLFILLSTFTFAQKGISVEYVSQINRDNKEATEKEIYILNNNNVRSIYKPKINQNTKKYINTNSLEKRWYNKKQNVTSYKVSPTTTVYSTDKLVFKDFSENQLYTNRILITSRAIVDESDIKLNWDIVNSKTEINILGYNCQKAFTKFRGRTYFAYFTNQLPFFDGPYKFKGLPGLILKIESTDGYYKSEAVKINILKDSIKIQNPFLNEKMITLEEFTKKYRSTLIKRLKASKSLLPEDDQGPITIKFDDKLEDIGLGVIVVD